MKKYITVLCLLTLFLPLLTSAHPGHGNTDGYTIIHYITEPVHAFVWVASLFVTAMFLRYFIRFGKKEEKI
jgi:hypothetical protein